MNRDQVDFHAKCTVLRNETREIEMETRRAVADVGRMSNVLSVEAREAGAHLMLAVRHLEDARMRLGKAIQYACNGGVSSFDEQPARPDMMFVEDPKGT
jgi:hypothetical protein